MSDRLSNVARCFLTAALIWMAACCCPPPAQAGAIASCRAPFGFGGAEVNIVVLPYFQEGRSPVDLNGTGTQIALLLKLETLFRATEFDRWGIILMTGNKQECDPDVIEKRMMGSVIQPGGRLILLWGKLYQQDDDIYLQSYLRFFRRPMPNESAPPIQLLLDVGGKPFVGDVISQDLVFPPELLSRKELDAIQTNYDKSAFFYQEPNLGAPKKPIPLDQFRRCMQCEDPLAFTVEARQGDWIRVKQFNGPEEYLLAHLDEGMSLDRRLPEVTFVQGLLGHLRYQSNTPQRPVAAMKLAESALMRYTSREDAAREPETKAVALQLAGILDSEVKGDTGDKFDVAFNLVPYSSDARNLAAMWNFSRAANSPESKVRPREIADDFVAAVALDPENPLVLANLQSFYELMASGVLQNKIDAQFALPPPEIESRLAQIKAIRKKMTAQAIPATN
jgi:hypothetical protein